MSTYEEYAAEKEQLDFLLEEGRRIVAFKEDLDGAVVVFSKPLADNMQNEANEPVVIRLGTADARKHVAVLLIRQQQDGAEV